MNHISIGYGHKIILYGIIGQFGIVLHPHLFEDMDPMGTYGLYTQEQFVRDVAYRLSPGDHAEDLGIPCRKAADGSGGPPRVPDRKGDFPQWNG